MALRSHRASQDTDPNGVATSAGAEDPPRAAPQRVGIVTHLAVSGVQMIALLGIIGLAVLAGAILVSTAHVAGWIDGLAIGAGAIILTMLVMAFGGRAKRPPRRRSVR